ncbi:MAG TPA: hypothetical protein PLY35_13055 [Thermotogota bacterium]|nr:hypothetical protein [Thermotogota bacterium]
MNDKLSDILLNINITFSELFKHNYKITNIIYGNPWDDYEYAINVNIYNIAGISSELTKAFNSISDNYVIYYNHNDFFKIVFEIN